MNVAGNLSGEEEVGVASQIEEVALRSLGATARSLSFASDPISPFAAEAAGGRTVV